MLGIKTNKRKHGKLKEFSKIVLSNFCSQVIKECWTSFMFLTDYNFFLIGVEISFGRFGVYLFFLDGAGQSDNI